jgi:hypothetical protein
MSHVDDALRFLGEQRDFLAESEARSTEKLEILRAKEESWGPIYQDLAQALGLSEGVARMIAADARLVAAAEAEFDAIVKAREAINKVMAEVKAAVA